VGDDLFPPVTSTVPSWSSVAVNASQATFMLPVVWNEPVAGLKISAVLVEPEVLRPPATRTVPSDSNVAVWSARGMDILPVATNVRS
jgi:hypothetical protein